MTVLTKTLILLIAVFEVFPAHATTSRGCSEDLSLYSRLLMLMGDKASQCIGSEDEFRELDSDYWRVSLGDRVFRDGLEEPHSTGSHSFVKKRQEMTVKGQVEDESDPGTIDVLNGYKNVRH